MEFEEYQNSIQHTLIYREKIAGVLTRLGLEHGTQAYINVSKLLALSYTSLGMGEAGEVQGKIKKVIRDSGGMITDEVRMAIAGELGDTLWYLAAVADELGLNLGDIAQANLNKLADRKDRGVIEGSGDTR